MLSEEVLIKNFSNDWYEILKPFLTSREFNNILLEVERSERQGVNVFPEPQDRFRAFRATPLEKFRVLLIGMDPYPTLDVATGLCFGISRKAKRVPPSLKIIAKEIESTTDSTLQHYSLEHWAQQGVLMLNTALTVVESKPGSHMNIWAPFTKYVIQTINDMTPKIIILWGKNAQYYENFLEPGKHQIIKTCHPVYEQYSGGKGDFLGSNMFPQINKWLQENKEDTIRW